MKLKHVAVVLLLPTSAFARGYEMKSVPQNEVENHMIIGSDETGTPAPLQGLWWMDGNPLADEVVSFASTHFEQKQNENGVVTNIASIPIYDEGVWAWQDSARGRFLYNLVSAQKVVYHLTFTEDFSSSVVVPELRWMPFLPSSLVPSSAFVTFSMKKVNDDEYSRDSILLGRHTTYRFRRIVDGEGNHLPAYEEFLKKSKTRNALLPVCTLESENTLPTSCVE